VHDAFLDTREVVQIPVHGGLSISDVKVEVTCRLLVTSQ
jgi:hypothetical protein